MINANRNVGPSNVTLLWAIFVNTWTHSQELRAPISQYVACQVYDIIEEFNVDSKAECVQLNLARKKYKKN